jgi:uncharacterized membrane protein YciS (DUF1049 family)
MFALKMIFGTGVFFVLIFVLLQNAAELVNIHFFALRYTNVKLFWVLFFAFVAGAVIMAIFAFLYEVSLRVKLGRKERMIARLEQDLRSVRSMSLEDIHEDSEEP